MTTKPLAPTDANLDRPRTVFACTLLSVGAGAFFNCLPVMLAVMARTLGFSEAEIGWLGSAELSGVLLGSCTAAWALRFAAPRFLATIGMTVLLLATVSTFAVSTIVSACTLRALSGFGCGLSYAVAVAILTRSSSPVRNVGVLNAAAVVVGALQLAGLPLVADEWGFHTMMGVLLAMVVLAALVLPWIPTPPTSSNSQRPTRLVEASPRRLLIVALLAMTLFQTAPGVSWAYIESVAHAASLSAATVGIAFATASLVAAGACLLAWRATSRFGLQAPLLAAMAVYTLVVAGWAWPLEGDLDYMLRLAVSGTAWALVTVFQQTSLGSADASGRAAALIPAAQGLGQAIGPLGGAALLSLGYSLQNMLVWFVLPLCISLLLCTWAHRRLGRTSGRSVPTVSSTHPV